VPGRRVTLVTWAKAETERRRVITSDRPSIRGVVYSDWAERQRVIGRCCLGGRGKIETTDGNDDVNRKGQKWAPIPTPS
jgi:hypothetical protein